MALTATKFFLDEDRQLTAEDEEEFFRSLKVRNTNSKQTRLGRLDALNDAAIALIRMKKWGAFNALDIGISSGVTTFEFNERLKAAGLFPSMTATDLSFTAFLVDAAPECRVLVDASGDILQFDLLGQAIRPWRRRLDFVNGMLFVKAGLHKLYADKAKRMQADCGDRARQIQLLNPRLAAARDITILEDDILKPNASFHGKFQFVRAANILNREYFDRETITGALLNLGSYLCGPGAMLLVGRTNDSRGHDASFYELDERGARFNEINRIGRGSELDDLIRSLTIQARQQ